MLKKYLSLKYFEEIENKPYSATMHKNKSARKGPVTKANGINKNIEFKKWRNEFIFINDINNFI